MVRQHCLKDGLLAKCLVQTILQRDSSVKSTEWSLSQLLVQCPLRASLARDLVLPIHLVNKRRFNNKMVNKTLLLTISVLTWMVWGMGKRF